MGYDGPNRISLRGSNRLPRRENPPNPGRASEGDQFSNRDATYSLHAGLQQGFNTLVVLGTWSIWKTRNDVMFNGAAPRINRALLLAREEAEFWMLAGAKDLSAMVATRLPN